MKQSLENVHVVIYSKKHLKEAAMWVSHYGYDVEESLKQDWKYDNHYFTFSNNSFGLKHLLLNENSKDISLNQLIKIIVDLKSEKVKEDKFTELKAAHKNGAVIQYRSFPYAVWWDCKNNTPEWRHDAFYRIKPEEPKKQECKEEKEFFNLAQLTEMSNIQTESIKNLVIRTAECERKIENLISIQAERELKEIWYSNDEEPKLKVGDYVISELKSNPEYGFSVSIIVEQHTADYYNQKDCPHHTQKIEHKDFLQIKGFINDQG